MSDLTQEAIDRLQAGGTLSWPMEYRLRRCGDARLVPALVSALEQTDDVGQRLDLLHSLRSLAAALPAVAECLGQLPLLERLVGVLATVETALDPDVEVVRCPRTIELLQQLEALLQAGGAVVLDSARRLLDAAPLASLVISDLSLAGVVASGPKLIALGIVGRHGNAADDAGRVESLARALDEDAFARAQASVLWHRWAGHQVAATVVDAMLSVRFLSSVSTKVDGFSQVAGIIATIGGALVDPLLDRLSDNDYTVRHRAVRVLEAIGDPATQALVELVRSTADWRLLANAEEALASIDRRQLRSARQARETDGRGLSLAESEAPAERGLSRAEGSPEP